MAKKLVKVWRMPDGTFVQPSRAQIKVPRRRTKGTKGPAVKPKNLKKQKVRTDVIRPIVDDEGATVRAKVDARVSNETAVAVYASGVNDSISEIIQVQQNSFYGVGFAYVCAAVQRGFLATASGPQAAFWAWQYICSLWQSYTQATIPSSISMPYWMWAFARAVSPKNTGFQNGNISYKFLQSTNTPPTVASLQTSPSAYMYASLLYIPAAFGPDMFPTAVAPTSGTNEQQEQAFQDLITFMLQNGNKEVSQMCDSGVETVFDKDVSAFACPVLPTGWGNLGIGGNAYVATLEVPIQTPLLTSASFASNTLPQGDPTRFPAKVATFGGDTLFIGNCLSNLMPPEAWKFRNLPRFHFIDFLEIADVVAIWASQIVTQYFADPSNFIAVQVGASELPQTQVCPLSLQEMTLILRNEVMYMFAATQPGVQSILPVLPAAGVDNQFMPYQVGSNTCALKAYGMLLPNPLVENLRALLLHICHTGKRKWENITMFYPVIGQYANDVLVSDDYQFGSFANADGEPVPVSTNTFSSLPGVVRKKRVSGVETWVKDPTETVIDLIDGGDGSGFVFINDTTRLASLVSVWNKWVTTYSAYSSPLTVVSIEPGVNVLTSINQIRHWTHPFSGGLKETEVTVKDTRLEKARELSATVFANRQAFALSFHEKPLGATSAITSKWILPINFLTTGSGSTNSSGFVKIETMTGEPFSIVTTAIGTQGQTLASLHTTFATEMTHGKDSKSMLDSLLESLQNKGEAGILSSLVADFAGAVFGGPVGQVAQTIAKVLPF